MCIAWGCFQWACQFQQCDEHLKHSGWHTGCPVHDHRHNALALEERAYGTKLTLNEDLHPNEACRLMHAGYVSRCWRWSGGSG